MSGQTDFKKKFEGTEKLMSEFEEEESPFKPLSRRKGKTPPKVQTKSTVSFLDQLLFEKNNTPTLPPPPKIFEEMLREEEEQKKKRKEQDEQDEYNTRISVRDTGLGLSEEDASRLQRIFDQINDLLLTDKVYQLIVQENVLVPNSIKLSQIEDIDEYPIYQFFKTEDGRLYSDDLVHPFIACGLQSVLSMFSLDAIPKSLNDYLFSKVCFHQDESVSRKSYEMLADLISTGTYPHLGFNDFIRVFNAYKFKTKYNIETTEDPLSKIRRGQETDANFQEIGFPFQRFYFVLSLLNSILECEQMEVFSIEQTRKLIIFFVLLSLDKNFVQKNPINSTDEFKQMGQKKRSVQKKEVTLYSLEQVDEHNLKFKISMIIKSIISKLFSIYLEPFKNQTSLVPLKSNLFILFEEISSLLYNILEKKEPTLATTAPATNTSKVSPPTRGRGKKPAELPRLELESKEPTHNDPNLNFKLPLFHKIIGVLPVTSNSFNLTQFFSFYCFLNVLKPLSGTIQQTFETDNNILGEILKILGPFVLKLRDESLNISETLYLILFLDQSTFDRAEISKLAEKFEALIRKFNAKIREPKDIDFNRTRMKDSLVLIQSKIVNISNKNNVVQQPIDGYFDKKPK